MLLFILIIVFILISLPAEDYQRLCNFILQELDMALNHTHDTRTKHKKCSNTIDSAPKKDPEKDTAKEESGESDNRDLLEGRTLLEVEALLIMSMTRMKIKGGGICLFYTLNKLLVQIK